NGHTAIIYAVDTQNHTVTTLEQNFQLSANHYYPQRVFSLSSNNKTIDTTSYTVPGVGFTSNPDNAVLLGWLHNGSSNTGSNPTFTGHEVYVIGSNGHLYHYFYSSGWSPSPEEDLSAATGATAYTLQGDVSTYFINGNHFAYAIDTNHHLHEF